MQSKNHWNLTYFIIDYEKDWLKQRILFYSCKIYHGTTNRPKSNTTFKTSNIYYLEMCRVLQKDGRVLYLFENKKEYQYWNIPIANTTCLLLGTGTSITQPAMRVGTSWCLGWVCRWRWNASAYGKRSRVVYSSK